MPRITILWPMGDLSLVLYVTSARRRKFTSRQRCASTSIFLTKSASGWIRALHTEIDNIPFGRYARGDLSFVNYLTNIGFPSNTSQLISTVDFSMNSDGKRWGEWTWKNSTRSAISRSDHRQRMEQRISTNSAIKKIANDWLARSFDAFTSQ